MAGTVVADTLQAASTSTLVIKNGVANTPPTIQDSAGTQIGTFCRAWVNFNGTTVTNPASMTGVRASFNVSSILDNGTGDYTISFTTAMPDTNYTVVGSSADNNGGTTPTVVWLRNQVTAPTASAVRIGTRLANNTDGDSAFVNVAVFR
jgi:hypothetical protein